MFHGAPGARYEKIIKILWLISHACTSKLVLVYRLNRGATSK